jgi:uncharacterized protein YndB with AHSA1/START domain
MTTDTRLKTDAITLEEDFPQRPEIVWKALTTGALIARWLGMEPAGFSAAAGCRFTYRTSPAGAWDGTIRCEVLEAVPRARLVYSWQGGHADNVGYGAPLDTVVTFTLAPAGAGTRLRLVHAGFHLPRNATAYTGMSAGWTKCARNLHEITGKLEGGSEDVSDS